MLARSSERGWEVCLVRAARYWGLPKGHLEAGETPREAALREIAEECGLEPQSLQVIAELPPSEYVYRRAERLRFKLVHHFLVIAPADAQLRPQASEIDEAHWLSIDDAIQRASFADTRAALEAAPPRQVGERGAQRGPQDNLRVERRHLRDSRAASDHRRDSATPNLAVRNNEDGGGALSAFLPRFEGARFHGPALR